MTRYRVDKMYIIFKLVKLKNVVLFLRFWYQYWKPICMRKCIKRQKLQLSTKMTDLMRVKTLWGVIRNYICSEFHNGSWKHSLILPGGAVQELGPTHQISAYISLRSWTKILVPEFGADQTIHVEIVNFRSALNSRLYYCFSLTR